MILSKAIVSRIEGLLEKGHTIELRYEEGDPVPTEGGGTKPRPPQVTVFKRPDQEDDIRVNPTLLNQEGPTNLAVYGIVLGEDPVLLAMVTAPAGWHLTGLKGSRNISQEIPEGKK